MSSNFSFESASGELSNLAPLRIAILGDFGGQPAAAEKRSSGPFRVDCDNFDQIFAKIGVTLKISPYQEGAGEINLHFRNLEDFHPDKLLPRVDTLANLFDLRAKLLHPASSHAAAKELQDVLKIGAAPANAPLANPAESTEELLARLLEKPASERPVATSPAALANRLIQKIVGPNAPGLHPQQSQLAALADAELSARLRTILHHPAFQALEASWRGLDFLVRNITEEVKLHLINVREGELATILTAEDWAKSVIYKQLEEIRPAMVLGIYTFGPQDNTVLMGIASLAHACQTALVAGASPHLVGCSSFGRQPDPDDWTKGSSAELESFGVLRRMPEAAHLGLAMPRFLLRQPYGKGSDAIESFPFEEMPAEPDHESYLWGNPAFLFGYLLADAFASVGSEMDAREEGGEVSGLPIHKFTIDGEIQVKPCAEAWLSDRAAAAILSRGIMPVLSVRGRDAVQLLTLRALTNPPVPLSVRLEFEE